MVPSQYSPSNAARSLTAHDRAKCPRRRARSFDEGVIVSRPSAVGRDVIVTLYTKKLLFILTFDVRMQTNMFIYYLHYKAKTNLLKADKMTTLVARNRASRAT